MLTLRKCTLMYALKLPCARQKTTRSLIASVTILYIHTMQNVLKAKPPINKLLANTKHPSKCKGYNNFCIYIDKLPGKYITVWIFELMLISFSIYEFLVYVSVRVAYEKKVYTKTEFYIMRAMSILNVILITYTIEVFAVHPENVFMHTLPFW